MWMFLDIQNSRSQCWYSKLRDPSKLKEITDVTCSMISLSFDPRVLKDPPILKLNSDSPTDAHPNSYSKTSCILGFDNREEKFKMLVGDMQVTKRPSHCESVREVRSARWCASDEMLTAHVSILHEWFKPRHSWKWMSSAICKIHDTFSLFSIICHLLGKWHDCNK